MKLLFMLLAVASSFFAKATPPEGIPPHAVKAFETTFTNAQHVSWAVENDLYRTNFLAGDRFASAYFDETGSLVVVTRNITQHEIPFVLQSKLSNDYGKYEIKEIVEASDQWGIHYYLTMENDQHKVILKSASGTYWNKISKTKK